MEIDDYLRVREDKGSQPSYTIGVKNNQYYIYDQNSCDADINLVDRQKLIYDIKELIDHILGIKRAKELLHGYFWNDWRKWIVLFRTQESDDFEAYLNEIEANLDTYHTWTLLHIKKELYRFWRAL